jgi:hypothetical protein
MWWCLNLHVIRACEARSPLQRAQNNQIFLHRCEVGSPASSSFILKSKTMSSLFFTHDVLPQIIIEIKKADVLLGRGKRVHTWSGNVAFRKLCEAAATAYRASSSSSGDGNVKETIVQKVIDQVHGAGGRFLREQELLAVDGTRYTVWLTIPPAQVRIKVKQACRDTVRIRARGSRIISSNNIAATTPSIKGPRCDHRPAESTQHLGKEERTNSEAPGEKLRLPFPSDVGVQSEESSSPGIASTPKEPSDAELLQALLSMNGAFSASSRNSSSHRQRKPGILPTRPTHWQAPHRLPSDDGPSLYHAAGSILYVPPPPVSTIAASTAFAFVPERIPHHSYGPAQPPPTLFASTNPSSSLLGRHSYDRLMLLQADVGATCTATRGNGDAVGVPSTASCDHDDDTMMIPSSLLTEQRLLAADPLAPFFLCRPAVPEDETMFRP